MAINGIDKGQTLPEIVARYGAEFLGKKNYEKFGNDFPLLIKFIDARQDLSIQVHPDDELSAQRHGKMGKNEMWYVVDADRGSQLIAGFTQKIETSEYAQKVADGSIENDLNKVCVSEGDCFYIPAGRVHGIGAGMVIAEIQQTSDVTYRIYDYLRRDRDGNLRELHTELALDAIDFEDITTDPKVNYTEKRDDIVSLVQCPFFTTNELKLTQSFKRDYTGIDSFRVYMCLSGQCCFLNPNGQSIFLHQGESLVVPAAIKEVTILPDENVKLLESYVE
jgi:mannose-6-phosphate isomerase